MHIGCYVVNTCKLYHLHIACYWVSTNYTVGALHVTDDANTPNCDCRQGTYYHSTYPSWLCFSDIWSFCCNLIFLISAEFFAVWVYLQFLRWCAVLWLRLDSYLPLGPIACRYGYNTFLQLPNSNTIIKYFPLYHTVI